MKFGVRFQRALLAASSFAEAPFACVCESPPTLSPPFGGEARGLCFYSLPACFVKRALASRVSETSPVVVGVCGVCVFGASAFPPFHGDIRLTRTDRLPQFLPVSIREYLFGLVRTAVVSGAVWFSSDSVRARSSDSLPCCGVREHVV